MIPTTAQKIVEAILSELSGRSGIGNQLDEIDDDIKKELKKTLVRITHKILCKEGHTQ